MIIADLIGGLGNQMFQYAAARSLAELKDTTLKLNIQAFETYTLRQYELGDFNISSQFATANEVEKLCPKNRLRYKSKILFDRLSRTPYYKTEIFREHSFDYDINFDDATDNVILIGYWQSEKYFKRIENIILNEFKLKSPLVGRNLEMAKTINNTNAVSLHVRRGDFISNAKTNSVHGTCSIDYYLEAIKMISERVNEPTFYIFSDDHKWVSENFSSSHNFIHVNHNEAKTCSEDLRLMSLCQYNIIANSSFSWWGAWLNNNPDKIIIAPQKWYADSHRNMQTQDLIPSTWLRI